MNVSVPEYVLLGLGNPLLDIMVQVDLQLLNKYDLKVNDAILAEEKHISLFHEILKRKDVQFVPGGATQNALRVFQWIVGVPNCATFFGAVGKDKYSDILTERAKAAGLNVLYQYNKSVKTGTCAGLVYEHNRSLCADLAAANTFTEDHLEYENNAKFVEMAKFYYISGFFLTVCPKAILKVADHAAAENKYFCMNLAAPFISQYFSDSLNDAIPYVDIFFANEEEAEAYALKNDLGTTNLIEIAQKICELEKVNKKRNRTVIITQGPGEIIVVTTAAEPQLFKVPPVENIVDTNGAGDAFCGGFLAELIRGSPLPKCIECGCFAASVIIQHQGCTFPQKCSYEYN